MRRIGPVLESGIRRRRPLIVPFVTAGFPRLDDSVGVVEAMAAAGADMVEVGMPFSDPLADGPTIQRASERALANGVRIATVLEIVRELRRRGEVGGLPILLMGYCNPLYRYGMERFLDDAADAGVDGLIVPDLPPEEGREYRDGCADRDLAAVFLVAPNASDERLRLVDRFSTDFSYCVTVTGVTGARGAVQERTVEFLERMRRVAEKPFVAGFGVKSGEHVLRLGRHADGVVVGSALLDAMEGAEDPAEAAGSLVQELSTAADELCRSRRERPS